MDSSSAASPSKKRRFRSRKLSSTGEDSPDFSLLRGQRSRPRCLRGVDDPLRSTINARQDGDETGDRQNQVARRRRRRRMSKVCPKQTHQLATAMCVVCLLCLVELTSIRLIATTNSSVSQDDLVRRDVDKPVLLRRFSRYHSDGVVPPSSSFPLLRGRSERQRSYRQKEALKVLAPLNEVKTVGEMISHPRKPQAVRHVRATDHHDADNQSREGNRLRDQIIANYHYFGNVNNTRQLALAKPGLLGFSAIPGIALPDRLNVVESNPAFDISNRNLYIRGNEVVDEFGSRRIVMLGDLPIKNVLPKHRYIVQFPAVFTDITQLYSTHDSGDERISSMELRHPLVHGECVPMQAWQTTFNPSCNGLHELDLTGLGVNRNEYDFKLIGLNGFWRNAWRFDSYGGRSYSTDRETVALKTLRMNHRFEDAYFENNRIDAIVLDRLTASSHVISVFGFCGHSVVTEYADGKRLGDLADKMKGVPLARLRVARDIANGLADVHGIDGDGNATFVHLDINPANVVSIGGTLKLNDFNIGMLRQWNTTSKLPCGFPAKYPNPQWRSPEEARQEQNLTEKVDVFSLGHIFFRLICGHEPWHKLEPDGMPSREVLNEKVKRGILPTIKDEVVKSSDAEVAAIRYAMLRCYTFDPLRRPSAREVATFLQDSLNKLELAADTE